LGGGEVWHGEKRHNFVAKGEDAHGMQHWRRFRRRVRPVNGESEKKIENCLVGTG